MSVTCVEKLGSGALSSGLSPDGELQYIIQGTADEQTALTKLEDTAPLTHKTLLRDQCGVDPTEISTMWIGTVTYGIVDPTEGGDWSFRFDTGGGTQHVTQGLVVPTKYVASGTAPDFKGAIGVAEDRVEGVDIGVAVFAFEVTYYIDDADMMAQDIRAFYELSNKVNDAIFTVTINGKQLTFAAGEVRLLGVVGGIRRTEDQWEITCRFAVNPNKTGLVVGDITGIDKLGWQYLWVRYRPVEDGVAKAMVRQPQAVYVEEVYEYGDFDELKT